MPGRRGPPRGPRGPGCSRRCSRTRRPCLRFGVGRCRAHRVAAWNRSRGSSHQALVESPELLVAVVLDHDAAAAARARQANLGAERPPEVLLDALELGIGGRTAGVGVARAACARRRTSSSVCRTDRSCSRWSARTLRLVIDREPADRPSVTLVIRPSATAAWTTSSRSSRRSVFATVERARPTRAARSSWENPNSSISCRIGARRLDRVEILALEVLDEGELELLAVGQLADDGRDALEAGRLARRGRVARRPRAGSRRRSP